MSEIFNEEIEGNWLTIGQFFTCLKHAFEIAARSEQLIVFPDIYRCLKTLQRASAEDLAYIREIFRCMVRELDRGQKRRGRVDRINALVPSVRGGKSKFSTTEVYARVSD